MSTLPVVLCVNKTHFVAEFEAAGYEVVVAGVVEEQQPNRPDAWSQQWHDFLFETNSSLEELLERVPGRERLAGIVYYDDSYPALRVRGIERAPVPVLFYAVDVHVHSAWQPHMIGGIDGVCIAQRDYLARYRRFVPDARWLPLWAPEVLTPQADPQIPVCFRGNLNPVQRPERVAFLEALGRLVPLDSAEGEYQKPFCNSKIVINESIGDDVNFRVFEGLMSGALLVTPRLGNGLDALFQDGRHLILYERGNVQEAAEKILYFLAHDDERRLIAAAGRAEVMQRHSKEKRGEEIVRIFQSLTVSGRAAKFYSSAFRELFLQPFLNHHSLERRVSSLRDALGALAHVAKERRWWDDTLVFIALELGVILQSAGEGATVLEVVRHLQRAFPEHATLRVVLAYLMVKECGTGALPAIVEQGILPPEYDRGRIEALAEQLLASSFFRQIGVFR